MRKMILGLVMVVSLGILVACGGTWDAQRTQPAGNTGHNHMMPAER